MVPMLFPQTHITPREWDALMGVFPAIGLLRIAGGEVPAHLMQAERDGDAVFLPAAVDGDRIRHRKAQFQEWLRMNTGADRLLTALQEGQTPFFDDTSTSGIGQAIREGLQPREEESPEDDLFRAMLFLSMAEDLQLAEGEVDAEMRQLASKERRLFHQLHGSDMAADAVIPPVDNDPCARLPAMWISSWSRIALAAQHIPAALVVTSPSAFDAIARKAGDPDLWCRLDADTIRTEPDLRDAFRQGVADLASADTPPAIDALNAALNPAARETGITLSVFRLTDCPPIPCLRVLASGEGEATPDHPDGSTAHTPIVFVEGLFL